MVTDPRSASASRELDVGPSESQPSWISVVKTFGESTDTCLGVNGPNDPGTERSSRPRR
jgi:hypothetical protein